MKYFKHTDNEADLKAQYKRLAVLHHPDKNPNDPDATKRMQDINAEFRMMLRKSNSSFEFNDSDNFDDVIIKMTKMQQAIITRKPENILEAIF